MATATADDDRSGDGATDERDDESLVDGRRARGARNRDAVVAAILELMREGNPNPGAHEIAARSGVSVRSVFRHFDDLESLHEVAIEQVLERSAHLYAPPPATGDLRTRVRALVDQRARLFDEITPTRVVAERLRVRSQPIAAQLARAHTYLRNQIAELFADELRALPPAERRSTLDALDVVLSWPSWHQLRTDQGLTASRASTVLRHTVERLLAPSA